MTDTEFAKAVAVTPALHLATTAELFDALATRLQGDAIPEYRKVADVVRSLRQMLECSEDGRELLQHAPVVG